MKITNKLDLPKPFVDAVSKEYEYKDKRHSVTEMLKGNREIILTRRHHKEMEADVSDEIWMIFGTAVHKVLEESQEEKDELKETKIAWTFPNGYTLSGQQDLYSESKKRVTDYKTGSVWKAIYDDWEDYRKQTLYYALLMRKIGLPCDNGEIVMMMRNWEKTKSKRESDYPQCQVVKKHFDFTDEEFENAEKEIIAKFDELDKLKDVADNVLPMCTEKQRWATPTKYALMKKGRKTAVKLFDNEHDAELASESNVDTYVEARPGEDKKCTDYCRCNKWCPYYKEHYEKDNT